MPVLWPLRKAIPIATSTAVSIMNKTDFTGFVFMGSFYNLIYSYARGGFVNLAYIYGIILLLKVNLKLCLL